MSVVSSAVRRPAGFAKNFPAERQYWEYSDDFGATWVYNPAASITHPAAGGSVGRERYRLRFPIPFGLGGTFQLLINEDKADGAPYGSIWWDGVQILANTGAAYTDVFVQIPVTAGDHILEFRHGIWGGGATRPQMILTYNNVFYTGQTL